MSARQLLPLGIALALLIALPWLGVSRAMMTMATQTLVWVVLALSYNIVFGQTGLLSFCHAIFFGMGAFASAHVVNAATDGALQGLPVWAVPFFGFAAGGAAALVLGAVLALRTGVAFVMITMALSQLVIYLATAFDSLFGGEAGIGVDRAYGEALFGLASFGPQRQAYWLVLFWAVVAGLAMWGLTRTAFGLLANATRENEERTRFSGQSTYHIRLMAMVLGGAFAGLAGALHVLNIEQVSTDQLSLKTSAFALFMCVIGGPRQFLGPVLGAVLLSVLDKILPDYTGAWLLYLGLIFCAVVLYLPDGLSGALTQGARLWREGRSPALARRWGLGALGLALIAAGVVAAVEMANSLGLTIGFDAGAPFHIAGVPVDPKSPLSWAMTFVLVAGGGLILGRLGRAKEAHV